MVALIEVRPKQRTGYPTCDNDTQDNHRVDCYKQSPVPLDERYTFSDPRSASGKYGGSLSSPGRIHGRTERHLHGVTAAETTVTTVL
jgi:hypothetical protein